MASVKWHLANGKWHSVSAKCHFANAIFPLKKAKCQPLRPDDGSRYNPKKDGTVMAHNHTDNDRLFLPCKYSRLRRGGVY